MLPKLAFNYFLWPPDRFSQHYAIRRWSKWCYEDAGTIYGRIWSYIWVITPNVILRGRYWCAFPASLCQLEVWYEQMAYPNRLWNPSSAPSEGQSLCHDSHTGHRRPSNHTVIETKMEGLLAHCLHLAPRRSIRVRYILCHLQYGTVLTKVVAHFRSGRSWW